jgi:hypothetical protein
MLRKTMIVLATAAALTGALTADAVARGGGGGGGHGRGFGGDGHMVGGFGGAHMGGSSEAHFAGGLHHRSWFREANTTTPKNPDVSRRS